VSGPLRVDGIELRVDGEGPEVIVMVHGWPDTWQLWDPLVATLAPRWRCVRFTLPGFDVAGPRRLVPLAAMTRFLAQVVGSHGWSASTSATPARARTAPNWA
jgi:pimeloyl-ACP methyl ester carboxylesterase